MLNAVCPLTEMAWYSLSKGSYYTVIKRAQIDPKENLQSLDTTQLKVEDWEREVIITVNILSKTKRFDCCSLEGWDISWYSREQEQSNEQHVRWSHWGGLIFLKYIT